MIFFVRVELFYSTSISDGSNGKNINAGTRKHIGIFCIYTGVYYKPPLPD